MALTGITAVSAASVLAPERFNNTIENQSQRLQQEQPRAEASLVPQKETLISTAVRAVPPVLLVPAQTEEGQAAIVEEAAQDAEQDEGAARLFLFQQKEAAESFTNVSRAREAFAAALKLQEDTAEESKEAVEPAPVANDNAEKTEAEEAPESVDISV